MFNEQGHDWTGKTILVVEDDEANYLYFKSLLKKTGAKLIWEKNGHEALKAVQEIVSIDLILMDVLIPFVNGIDVTREIRKQKNTVPVIIITAYTSKEIRQNSYMAGCNEFLTKPVLPNELLKIISKYFYQSQTAYVSETSVL
jgi:CheY-like chemotaxis protein